MSFADDFREFVFETAREQAGLYRREHFANDYICQLTRDQDELQRREHLVDSPQRTAPPDEHGPGFGELPEREQLDILGRLSQRSTFYAETLLEALVEAPDSARLLRAALDPDCTPADLGRRLRECLIGYCESVAAQRGDELERL